MMVNTDNGKFLAWVLRIAHNLVITITGRKTVEFIGREDFGQDILNSRKYCG